MMNRRTARELALHIIFELGFSENSAELLDFRRSDEGQELLADQNELFEAPLENRYSEYVNRLTSAVANNLFDIDVYIEKYMVGWNVSRASRMCMAILRLCIAEILYLPDVPPSSSINEAVELAKKYENEDIPPFINGVLGAFVRGEQLEQ